jgi:hypothetical protein
MEKSPYSSVKLYGDIAHWVHLRFVSLEGNIHFIDHSKEMTVQVHPDVHR